MKNINSNYNQWIILILIMISSGFSGAQNLDAYFQVAANNNPGLQAKYKEFEAAMQEIPQVGTLADPALSFGYFISPVETRVGPQRFKLSLSQMFPWFGTLKERKSAAALSAEAKYQDFLEARNKLYFELASSYYPLFKIKRWQQLEQENIEILKSYKIIATSIFENGKGPMVDVLRADIILKEAQTNLDILLKQEKPLRTRFNKILNRDTDEEVVIADSLILQPVMLNFRRDSMLHNNPVLKKLDLNRQASEAREKAASKEALPKLGVGVDYTFVGKREDVTMDDNGKDVIMPMVSVTVPIFRNKYEAAIKQARLRQESFSLQADEYRNKLIADYEDIQFTLEQKEQMIALYEQQIEESQQALNLLNSAYSNSGKDFDEVLGMQQQLLKYYRMKASALSEYYISLAKLYYLTALNNIQR